MAQPTTTRQTDPPKHAATPGVGQTPGSVARMGPAPEGARVQSFDTAPADPVLAEDCDWVALQRLYPHAKSRDELRALAMEAGNAARDAGLKLRAAQDEEPPPAA